MIEEIGCAGTDSPDADGSTSLVAELILVEAEAHAIFALLWAGVLQSRWPAGR